MDDGGDCEAPVRPKRTFFRSGAMMKSGMGGGREGLNGLAGTELWRRDVI